MDCKSYEIYLKASKYGEANPKSIDELSDDEQNGWYAIDKYYLMQIQKLIDALKHYQEEDEGMIKRENAVGGDDFLQ